jgi:hypothetical protein
MLMEQQSSIQTREIPALAPPPQTMTARVLAEVEAVTHVHNHIAAVAISLCELLIIATRGRCWLPTAVGTSQQQQQQLLLLL